MDRFSSWVQTPKVSQPVFEDRQFSQCFTVVERRRSVKSSWPSRRNTPRGIINHILISLPNLAVFFSSSQESSKRKLVDIQCWCRRNESPREVVRRAQLRLPGRIPNACQLTNWRNSLGSLSSRTGFLALCEGWCDFSPGANMICRCFTFTTHLAEWESVVSQVSVWMTSGLKPPSYQKAVQTCTWVRSTTRRPSTWAVSVFLRSFQKWHCTISIASGSFIHACRNTRRSMLEDWKDVKPYPSRVVYKVSALLFPMREEKQMEFAQWLNDFCPPDPGLGSKHHLWEHLLSNEIDEVTG